MILTEVSVSGTVGKQVVATDKVAVLRGMTLTPSAANLTIKIRHGNASGDVVLFARALSASGSLPITFNDPMKFTRGMHVKVIGTNATAYLEIS